jgi:hypothetical protein
MLSVGFMGGADVSELSTQNPRRPASRTATAITQLEALPLCFRRSLMCPSVLHLIVPIIVKYAARAGCCLGPGDMCGSASETTTPYEA